MSIIAMKQALDALNHWGTDWAVKQQLAKETLQKAIDQAEKQVSYCGNGTAGRENMTEPTGFFFQMPKVEEPVAWVTDLKFDSETELIPARRKGKLGTGGFDIPLYTKANT